MEQCEAHHLCFTTVVARPTTGYKGTPSHQASNMLMLTNKHTLNDLRCQRMMCRVLLHKLCNHRHNAMHAAEQ
jgi:hypothetical protein